MDTEFFYTSTVLQELVSGANVKGRFGRHEMTNYMYMNVDHYMT